MYVPPVLGDGSQYTWSSQSRRNQTSHPLPAHVKTASKSHRVTAHDCTLLEAHIHMTKQESPRFSCCWREFSRRSSSCRVCIAVPRRRRTGQASVRSPPLPAPSTQTAGSVSTWSTWHSIGVGSSHLRTSLHLHRTSSTLQGTPASRFCTQRLCNSQKRLCNSQNRCDCAIVKMANVLVATPASRFCTQRRSNQKALFASATLIATKS
jgi:hypothetical protein